MDDNARPHQTLAVEELLESEDITRMDWPAYSPDLNPIEHVWDALGRRIAARLHHPENTQQLKLMLIEEWALLPQEMLHQLLLSMRRRYEATIALVVSEELGITQSIISRLWQRFQDDGNVNRCYSPGRPRVRTPNEDRYLAVTAKKKKRRSTASDLSRQLSSATGTTVSKQTVYRRLGHIGLHARRPVRCVTLTATHCRLRLTWSREHALWTPQQWSCVMFYDETRFSLQSDSRRTLIWRAPGTRYHQENTIERHRYGGAGRLVWGGIMFGSRTDLHVQSVTMTGHIYRDVILEQHVRLFRGAMGNFC
ncbi:transposable element Tcb1 transposase [Trichonephila clavipes]|nr:transposable element Tcb1 transposase [Trichonephila clavipes]